MSTTRRFFVTAMLTALGCVAGCASSPAGQSSSSVRVVGSDSGLGDDYVFVDVHIFSIERRQRGDMNRIARDYARSLGADTAVVRVTDDSGPAILFSVKAYRRIGRGD